MDDLIRRVKARVADPMRAVDSAAWVRPLPTVAAPAAAADVEAAEAAIGFPVPPLLRRLYVEVGNGKWGPDYGLFGIPTSGAPPDSNDMVGFYLECTSPQRASETPAVEWPRGLVPLLFRGCVDYEFCDFLQPGFPVYLLSGDTWERDQPVIDAISPVASSLAERLEQWLESSPNQTSSSESTETN